MKLASKVPVYYITGNHDDALRRYSPADLGNLRLCDRLNITPGRALLVLPRRHLRCQHHARALAGQTRWLRIRSAHPLEQPGEPCARADGSSAHELQRTHQESVKRAVAYIGDSEETAANVAMHDGFQYVVCGHIHQPQLRTITTEKGSVRYMNSGDWIEHMSALEYADGAWTLYAHTRKSEVLTNKMSEREEELVEI
ncbi:MAG: metallophosphoesterase family protein [Flavobacteriales bacterium]|nr:metallophosphoesterase family protein [Flavobacteriales bacterium]